MQTIRGNRNQSQTSESNNNKWVINLSNTALTPAQESLLSKGLNYTIAPKITSNTDYIAAHRVSLSEAYRPGCGRT